MSTVSSQKSNKNRKDNDESVMRWTINKNMKFYNCNMTIWWTHWSNRIMKYTSFYLLNRLKNMIYLILPAKQIKKHDWICSPNAAKSPTWSRSLTTWCWPNPYITPHMTVKALHPTPANEATDQTCHHLILSMKKDKDVMMGQNTTTLLIHWFLQEYNMKMTMFGNQLQQAKQQVNDSIHATLQDTIEKHTG